VIFPSFSVSFLCRWKLRKTSLFSTLPPPLAVIVNVPNHNWRDASQKLVKTHRHELDQLLPFPPTHLTAATNFKHGLGFEVAATPLKLIIQLGWKVNEGLVLIPAGNQHPVKSHRVPLGLDCLPNPILKQLDLGMVSPIQKIHQRVTRVPALNFNGTQVG